MTTLTEQMTFHPGDAIKFQVTGFIPETAHYFLPKMRDRVFLGLSIVEKNGEPLPKPVSLECGVFLDELPTGKRMTRQGDQIALDDGMDPNMFWTATLTDRGGLPRARAENVGTWVSETSVVWIDGSSLVVTQESVPTLPQPQIQPTETAPEAARPQAKTGLRGWFAQRFEKRASQT